jgi:hypothetical protein
VDEFGREHRAFCDQIANIDRTIRDIKSVRDRHQLPLAVDDRDENEKVFDNFRSSTLDPSTLPYYRLDTGLGYESTYLQTPSRFASIGTLVSYYSSPNKSDMPGVRHPGISVDTRFGVLSAEEFAARREHRALARLNTGGRGRGHRYPPSARNNQQYRSVQDTFHQPAQCFATNQGSHSLTSNSSTVQGTSQQTAQRAANNQVSHTRAGYSNNSNTGANGTATVAHDQHVPLAPRAFYGYSYTVHTDELNGGASVNHASSIINGRRNNHGRYDDRNFTDRNYGQHNCQSRSASLRRSHSEEVIAEPSPHQILGHQYLANRPVPAHSGFGVQDLGPHYAPGSDVIFEEYPRAHYEERARAAAAEGATYQRRSQLLGMLNFNPETASSRNVDPQSDGRPSSDSQNIASHNTGPATIGDQIPPPLGFPPPMRPEPIPHGGHQEPARDVLTPPPQEFGEDGSPPPPAYVSQGDYEYARYLDELNEESRQAGHRVLQGDTIHGGLAIPVEPLAVEANFEYARFLDEMNEQSRQEGRSDLRGDLFAGELVVPVQPLVKQTDFEHARFLHEMNEQSHQNGAGVSSRHVMRAGLHPILCIQPPTPAQVNEVPSRMRHMPSVTEIESALSSSRTSPSAGHRHRDRANNIGSSHVAEELRRTRSGANIGSSIFGMTPGEVSREGTPPIHYPTLGRRWFDSRLSSPGPVHDIDLTERSASR